MLWRFGWALPSAFDAHLLASRRARLFRIVKCLVFLEDIILGHEHSTSCRCTHVHVRNWTYVVSDQTPRFALWTYMVFLQLNSKSIANRVTRGTNALLLWVCIRVVLISVANSVLRQLSNTLFHLCWFRVWIEVLKSMRLEVIKLLVALPA